MDKNNSRHPDPTASDGWPSADNQDGPTVPDWAFKTERIIPFLCFPLHSGKRQKDIIKPCMCFMAFPYLYEYEVEKLLGSNALCLAMAQLIPMGKPAVFAGFQNSHGCNNPDLPVTKELVFSL
ncbi:hypothetical protein QQP08_013843 [Theobroma cacao]|nr:hypothetical protein QQP08_013843 [Theobroma cacao]